MSGEPERWSGYATQSTPWQRGYEWAYGRGEPGKLDIWGACEWHGYAFGGADDEEFMRGVEFAQTEIEKALGK